jgi:hypothetical protein
LGAACLDALENRTLMSTTYYVAPWGIDQAAGTLAQPFRTIQEAANVAYSGDTVSIEAGTYHETVKPPHAGVTFTNYNNQTVTISGADPVTGFWNYSGNVYEANLATNLGEGNEEVFVDGQLLNEARFPNTSVDPSHPTKATIGAYSNSTIYDSSLTQANGYWVGADINIVPGDAWTTYTGSVTASGPGWITVSLPITGAAEQPQAGNSYYLFGKYQALDSAGEWYVDSSNHLYLWDQYGDNPSNHDVEVKAREYGFDLSGVSNTTIQGVNLYACTIHTDGSSTGTTINGITATYITQYAVVANGWWPMNVPLGIELYGSNSTFENSTIAYSAGDGVFVDANNVTVNNNVIHDVDYAATDAAGIRVIGSNDTISNNTIYNAGRDGINLRGVAGLNILSNTIHDVMLQTTDGGGIYTYNDNGAGTVIAYNAIYSINVPNGGLDGVGIYLDADSSNFIIHDNTTANVQSALKLNNTSYNEAIYNNHLGANLYTIESNAWPGYPYNWSGTQFYNNVYYNPNLMMGANVQQWGNTYATGSPAIPAPTTNIVPPAPPAPASPPPPPPPTVVTPAATASFVKSDTTTEGTWTGTYGADGYSIFNGASSLPSYAQLTTSGAQNWTWQQSTNGDARTLQAASGSGNRLAACDYSGSSFTLDLNLTDGKTHQVALYALNWDSWSYRNETITVTDASTGAVLDSRNAANFGNGQWLVWNLSGHVKITVTNNAGLNAVASGIFFGPQAGATLGATASFLKTDSTTQGTWTGTYGADGYLVANAASNLPSYATLTLPSGLPNYTWNSSTGETRALQTGSGSSSRIAACDYSNSSSFTLNLNMSDGKAHQVAFYVLDYDARGRAETITITNASTGAVLDTESVSNFTQGKYLVWSLSGNVNVTFTNAGGLNEVVSGVFFR